MEIECPVSPAVTWKDDLKDVKKCGRASAKYSNAGRNAGAMEKPHGFVTGGLEVF